MGPGMSAFDVYTRSITGLQDEPVNRIDATLQTHLEQ